MTKFLQWNCRGIRTSIADLQTIIHEKRPAVVCIQETKLAPESYFSLRGYTTYRKDVRADTIAHGGVLLAVDSSVPSKQLTLNTTLQAVAARVHIGRYVFTTCSIYLPPGVAMPLAELRQLISFLPPPILVLGDFNSHNVVWGCEDTSARGRTLERLVNDESLCILNTGDRTHFTLPSGRTSVLDLSLCSPELVPSFTWSVGDDPMGSDHFPVLLQYSEVAILGMRPPRWNFQKADLTEFRTRLETVFSQHPEEEPLFVERFTSLLLNAAHGCIPRTSGHPRRPPVPWWSDQCRDAIRARRRAFRQFNRHSTESNLIAFRQARAATRRTILGAKRESWRQFVSGLNRSSPTSQIFTQIKRIAGQSAAPPTPVLRVGGDDVTHPVDVANGIGQALAKRCRIGDDDPVFARHKARAERQPVNFSTSDDLSYNQPFSMRELTSAIDQLRNVSEGPDRIHNGMLKQLPLCAMKALLASFNLLWARGDFPTTWREAIIVPVLKPGKDGSDPLHYRPIALTSCLCKLFEKMVNLRFTWFLEHNDVFTNAQCGFRKNRSTVDHLLTMDTTVRTAFQQKRHVGAVFFDIEGAYDTTWRYGVLLKAFNHGIRGQMGFFLQNFLRDRNFRVRVGGTLSDTFVQNDGIPQGSVMSVALFGLMINDVCDSLSPSIGRSLFVDDLSVFTTTSSAPTLARQLQLAVGRLETWCSLNGFRFSTSKTVAMHFCRRRRHCPDMAIKLHGKVIPCQPTAKFLGLILDRKLTYVHHIKELRERCFKSLNVLKCVSRTSYGADRATLLLLYRSLVRSKLDYACFVYDSASEATKRSLDAVHHAALRIATGAFRTTPKSSLLVEAHEPPLADRRALLGMRYACKLRQFPQHPTFEAVFSSRLIAMFRGARPRSTVPFCVRMRRLRRDGNMDVRHVMRSDVMETPPWELTAPDIDMSLTQYRKGNTPQEVLRSVALERIASYSGCVATYTDGSKTSVGVGCAFISGIDARSFTLPNYASVYTAELVAIQKALYFIEVSESPQHLILSDSLSSLHALSGFNPTDPLVQNIVIKLTTLEEEGKMVSLCWIPSHVAISGNERADAAAKRAAQRPRTRSMPVPARDHFHRITQFMRTSWQARWDELQDNKLSKIKPKLGYWASSSRRSRREEVALCRLRAGHTLATHRYLLCGDEKPKCTRCGADLSVRHVLVSCPCYLSERQQFFGPRSDRLSLLNLLGNESVHIDSVFRYLDAIGFQIIYNPG